MLEPVQDDPQEAPTEAAGQGREFDLTQVERNAPRPPTAQEEREEHAPAKLTKFDEKEHHARTSSRAVIALMGIVAFVTVASFAALFMHIEIQNIELLIFSLLALFTVVAGPVLGYLRRSTDE